MTYFILLIYVIILLIASFFDMKSKIIENWIPAAITILALIFRFSLLYMSTGKQFSNGNALLGFLVGVLPFFCIAYYFGTQKIGGGDVKFMAANGIFLGEKVLIASMIGLSLATIILFIYIVINKPKKGIALAPFLSIGCIICLFMN